MAGNRGIFGRCKRGSMTTRPFKVLGIQQVAVGSADKSALRRLWVETLGLTPHGNFKSEKENVDEDIVTMGSGPFTVEVDLMQPIDPAKKPRVDTPPLNHIGLWVDDIDAAVKWLADQGVRFTPGGVRPGAAGHRVCFIHPKGNESAPIGGEGVLIELVEAPLDVREAFEKISRASKPA
jgi:lactoylglutathione lyase